VLSYALRGAIRHHESEINVRRHLCVRPLTVCEIWVSKAQSTSGGVRLDSFKADKLIKEIVEELVPPPIAAKFRVL